MEIFYLLLGIAFIAAGIMLAVATFLLIVSAIRDTPGNLRGFYGAKYWLIGIAGFVGGGLSLFFGSAMFFV